MEVNPGYKQTEVGAIPEEWEVEKIGDLIEKQFILGHLDGNHGDLYPRSHEFKTYGVPYVGANDFEEGNVTFEHCKFLSDERAAKFHKGVAKDGDVLFAHNATVGPVALLRTDFPFVILSTTATYFRCNPEKLSNSYLKGALQAQHFVKQYQAVMAQSTRFQVPITAQRKLSLVIAPLPEQCSIAEALNDADALLGGLDRLIAKKRDLKQAAMQQLLTGQTRLPGFHGEWEAKRLGEVIVKLKKTTRPSSSGRAEGAYPFFTNTTKPVDRFLDETDFDTEAIIANTGGEAYFNYFNGSFAAMADCFVFEARVVTRFLYYFLKSVEREVNDNGFTGSGIKHLDKKYFYQLEMRCPSELPEQAAIAEVLTEMDAELAALEQRREKTRALKQAMMQELLTGRTRLIPPDVSHA